MVLTSKEGIEQLTRVTSPTMGEQLTTIHNNLKWARKHKRRGESNSQGLIGLGRQPNRGASLWNPGGQKQMARPVLLYKW